MTEQTGTKPAETDEQRMASHAWKRRGLLAAAWAAVAAIVTKQTTAPVEAATANVVYDTTGPGSIPNDVGSTVLLEPSFSGGGTVFQVQNTNSQNVTLIQAVVCLAANPGTAVNAIAGSGVGVQGQSESGIGVRGQISSFSSANAIAVYGLNNSTYAGPGPGGTSTITTCFSRATTASRTSPCASERPAGFQISGAGDIGQWKRGVFVARGGKAQGHPRAALRDRDGPTRAGAAAASAGAACRADASGLSSEMTWATMPLSNPAICCTVRTVATGTS
jgi:hypothetical protein